jgi:hypothetical protein
MIRRRSSFYKEKKHFHSNKRNNFALKLGEAHMGASLYDVAAWFGTINKGKNQGRPYLGLQLTSKSNAQKISVSLWEKANRKKFGRPAL